MIMHAYATVHNGENYIVHKPISRLKESKGAYAMAKRNAYGKG